MAAHAGTPRTPVAKVDRVSDRYTITAITSEGTKLRIRCVGIEALEVSQSTIQARSSESFQ